MDNTFCFWLQLCMSCFKYEEYSQPSRKEQNIASSFIHIMLTWLILKKETNSNKFTVISYRQVQLAHIYINISKQTVIPKHISLSLKERWRT